MRTHYSITILCFVLCLFSCELSAFWPDPSAGFEYCYDAESNMLPNNSATSPQWSRGYWTDTETYLVDSTVGGERALFMDATSTADPMKYGHFLLTASGGAGTKDDLITMDMRIRLADATQADTQPQFLVTISRPTEVTGQSQNYFFNFRENGIYSYDGQAKTANVGTEWHNYRIIIDCVKKLGWIYMDGSNTPLIVCSPLIQTNTSNLIKFGDGSSLITGKVELAYLNWTNTEAAFPLYQYSYKASCESLPSSSTVKPQWSRGFWTDTETYLVDSSVGGERALFMDATSTADPMKYGHFLLTTSGGAGTKDDLITMDMRIRLADATQADAQPQFFISISRPTETSGQSQNYMFNFRKNGIYSYDGQTQTASVGTDWHNYRILVDCVKQAGWIYMDGSDTPIIVCAPLIQTNTSNQIKFGDGSSLIIGKAELSFLNWTNVKADFPGAYKKQIVWNAMWDANELPEDFQNGDIFYALNYQPEGTTITRETDNITISNMMYSFETTGNSTVNANSSFLTEAGVFDVNTPSTIEFRIKNGSALGTYTNALMLQDQNRGYLGFRFEPSTNRVRPFESSSTYIDPYIDSEGWSVFRVTTSMDEEGLLSSAILYYRDSQGEWSTNTLVSNFYICSASYDGLVFGDVGVAYGGESSLDYLYFTNQGATTEDIPVAMTFSTGNTMTIATSEDPDDSFMFPWMVRLQTDSNNCESGYVLWLQYHWGVHVTDEHISYLWSFDEGETWETAPNSIRPFNCTQLSDGTVIAAACWSTNVDSTTHTVTTYKWDDPVTDTTPDSTTATLTMPFASSVQAHRSLVKPDPDNDDWLIQSCYGKRAGDSKYYVFVIETTDQGATWHYLATIARDDNSPSEGFDEPVLVRLADDTLMTIMRTGEAPAKSSKSSDGGETWSTLTALPGSARSYDPECTLLQDGTLLATIGTRPGVDIFVDRSGTGENWKKIGAPMFGTSGFYCSYTSLAEIEPGLLRMITTQSDFVVGSGYDGENRLFQTDFQISDNPASGNVEWDAVWNCDELPELATRTIGDIDEPLLKRNTYHPEGVSRDVSDGIYTVETATDSNEPVSPYNYRFESGVPSTIEVRFKNVSALSAYTTGLIVVDANYGYSGFRITNEHVVYPMETTSTSVKLYVADGWSTIRILTKCKDGKLTGTDLYYKNAEGMWIYGLSANMVEDTSRTVDTFWFGDLGLYYGGEWQTDYISWTNQAATLDAIRSPDPDYWYWTSERPPQ